MTQLLVIGIARMRRAALHRQRLVPALAAAVLPHVELRQRERRIRQAFAQCRECLGCVICHRRPGVRDPAQQHRPEFFPRPVAQGHDRFGSHIRPSEDAVPATDEARARQGLPRQPGAPGARR